MPRLLPLLPPRMRQQDQRHQVCCQLLIQPILRYIKEAAFGAGLFTEIFLDCSDICRVCCPCHLHCSNSRASIFLPGSVCSSLWLASSSIRGSCCCSSLLSASFCGCRCHLHCRGLNQLPGKTNVQPCPRSSGCHGGTTADSNSYHKASHFICTSTCVHLCLQQ